MLEAPSGEGMLTAQPGPFSWVRVFWLTSQSLSPAALKCSVLSGDRLSSGLGDTLACCLQ